MGVLLEALETAWKAVGLDGFTGFKSAAGEEFPRAWAALDSYSTGPGATLCTEADLLTNAQARGLETLFADEHHAPVQAAWGVYHRLIQAYCTEDPGLGKYLMQHNRPLAL